MATQRLKLVFRGKRIIFQDPERLKMGNLNRLLNFFPFWGNDSRTVYMHVSIYLSIYINIEILFWAITEEVQHGDTRGLISLSILELYNFNEICFFLSVI